MALNTATDSSLPLAGGGVPPAPRLRRRAYLTSWRRRAVAGIVVAGALGFLLFEGLDNATVYFKTADQAVADRSSLGTRQFRIEGTVEPGVEQAGGMTKFSIIANGVSVPVVDGQQPPQLFKPGIPVVLEGHWQGDVYQADQIMVKHSASYTEAHPDRLKSQLPQTPTTTGTP
ncbi:MAG TPA: cytochrome c maturation protein CcmE [Acidimicrobiales bacterium]|nr:cytochrome c maturation protein CcmE [Acidimicrobiales bacterium]